MTVHLVNLTNPMMMKGPVREVIPLSRQMVRVQIPEGKKLKAVRLLVTGEKPKYKQTGNYVEMEVGPIGLHEVIAIDLG
jgi:hypothetical protein